MVEITFRQARSSEAEEVASLINTAYRGERSKLGWTTEAHLLDGLRTSRVEIERLLANANAMIWLCLRDGIVVGSACLEHMGDHVHLGMFVIEPSLQNAGLGKQLLAQAEAVAQQRWKAAKITMSVITLRHELIAYYERRGYRRTGILRQFPVKPDLWKPKVPGLQLEILEKLLLTPPHVVQGCNLLHPGFDESNPTPHCT